MEKEKVLIVDEDQSNVGMVTEMLKKRLPVLDLEVDIFWAHDFKEATAELGFTDYDLIVIGIPPDTLDIPGLNKFMEYLLLSNKNDVCFFVSPAVFETVEIKKIGLDPCCLKAKNKVIKSDDLESIEEALKNSSKKSYQVMHKNLVNPVCVFSVSYVDSTSSEEWAQNACNEVALKLNNKQINYSAVASDGYCISIFVAAENVPGVKELTESSYLQFWSKWTKEYLV